MTNKNWWNCDRNLRLSTPIAIRVELSGLKGKIASALKKNEKLALIAISVEVRSQLKVERADREKIKAELSELKQNSAPAAIVSEKLTPDPATILSQLARQAQKIKNRLGGFGSHSRNFAKLRRQNFTATP